MLFLHLRFELFLSRFDRPVGFEDGPLPEGPVVVANRPEINHKFVRMINHRHFGWFRQSNCRQKGRFVSVEGRGTELPGVVPYFAGLDLIFDFDEEAVSFSEEPSQRSRLDTTDRRAGTPVCAEKDTLAGFSKTMALEGEPGLILFGFD